MTIIGKGANTIPERCPMSYWRKMFTFYLKKIFKASVLFLLQKISKSVQFPNNPFDFFCVNINRPQNATFWDTTLKIKLKG